MSEPIPAISRILVSMDTNRLGEEKLPAAKAQAKAFNAEIVLLHVISSSSSSDNDVTVEESQARAYLDAIAARLRAEGIRAQSLVSHGPVAEAVLEQVADQQADLLVIGSNVRHGFSHLLLGSIAEELIAHAPCPILLVRPKTADDQKAMPVRNFDDDAARTGPVAPRDLGARTVDIERIVGSVGRAQEMNKDFRVRNTKDRRRYERILKLMEEGTPLPPVALYKLGYGYYMLDGNHRVAAAKQLGQLEIDADVTEFVSLQDTQTKRVYAERRAFERTTGLTRIGAAMPGTYPRMEEMVRQLAQSRGSGDLQEVGHTWESEVYRPVARRIRSMRLGQRLPGLRSADIFAQIAECKEEEEEQSGRELAWEEAISRFVEKSCLKPTVPQAKPLAVA